MRTRIASEAGSGGMDPLLEQLLAEMGDAGSRLAAIRAAEGASGNLSVCVRAPVDPGAAFPLMRELEGAARPGLAGATVVITGSGMRLGALARDPVRLVGVVRFDAEGGRATLHTAERPAFARLTVELGAHLSVHAGHLPAGEDARHAVVHAQPPFLTYLTHIPAARGCAAYSRSVLRWHPELVYHLRDGIGYVPFMVPGTAELAAATLEAMRSHRLVAWEKHGVICRSPDALSGACDWIEYAEAGARFACMHLAHQGASEGLTDAEIHAICEVTGIQHAIY